MLRYSIELDIPKTIVLISLFNRLSFYIWSNTWGAYNILYRKRWILLSGEKISTGKLIFNIDCPESKFFAILVNTNFRTPFWSSIFFSLIKIIPPSSLSWRHSPFQIGWSPIFYIHTGSTDYKGSVIYRFLRKPPFIITYPR